MLAPRRRRRSRAGLLKELGLTPRDFVSHILLAGQTGSGKTTALSQILAALLEEEAPGAVHSSVKSSEAEWACAMVKRSRMKHRLLRIEPGKTFKFNACGYELSRIGGTPFSLSQYLIRLSEIVRRQNGPGNGEGFWKGLFGDSLHYASVIAWLAHGKHATFEHIHQIIMTSPASPDEARPSGDKTKPTAFEQSPCLLMMKMAEANATSAADKRALEFAANFFLVRLVGIGERARGAALQECSSILGFFLTGPMYESFCSPISNFTPEVPLNRVYCVLDFPVLVYGDAALIAQSLITQMTIDAALRQKEAAHTTLIVRDEMQMLVCDPQYETMVHSVARSHKLGFISAVQNLPLLVTAFGGQQAEQQMRALLGNYATHFTMAQGEMNSTNSLYSSMCGEHRERMFNLNQSHHQESAMGPLDHVFGTQPFHFGTSEQYRPQLPPDAWMHLRTGQPPDYAVDAYMIRPGRVFPDTKLPFRKVTFFIED